MRTALSQDTELHCFCGHLLRAHSERATGWCIECSVLQRALNDTNLNQLASTELSAPIVHMARKATRAEQEAIGRSSRQPGESESGFFHAYDLCEALNHLACALTQWAYVSARLWRLLQEGNPEQQATLADLHLWSADQFRRLSTIHLTMQARTLHFCEEHHIHLTFKIVDQACDLSTKFHTDTEADGSAKSGIRGDMRREGTLA